MKGVDEESRDHSTPGDENDPVHGSESRAAQPAELALAASTASEEQRLSNLDEGQQDADSACGDTQDAESTGGTEGLFDERGALSRRRTEQAAAPTGARDLEPQRDQPGDAASSRIAEQQQPDEDDFDWGAPKHIFVLSSAGKPVFSLSGDEQRLSTLMGLIQGLLSLCADCGGDEMESISAGRRRFVFLRRGDLVLVAVSSAPSLSSRPTLCARDSNVAPVGGAKGGGEEDAPECESFLRLQLEYMYASILFLLTSKV